MQQTCRWKQCRS